MSLPRAVVPFLVLVLAACGGEAGDGSGTEGASGTDSASTGGSTAATTAPTTTTATTAATTTTESATGVDDDCDDRPGGEWNACIKNGSTQNSLCNWVMGAGAGSITCLVPASGGHNVCGISECEDDCDCFAPPVTGAALVKCKAVYADGGKACVLSCLNGQTCPDGMACVAGACYWPN